MSYEAETPFDTIESAHQYLSLLLEAAHEAREAVAIEAGNSRYERRTEVLRLVSYNLEKLEKHVTISRRILNDLRMLRSLLLEQRASAALPTSAGSRAPQISGSPTTANYA